MKFNYIFSINEGGYPSLGLNLHDEKHFLDWGSCSSSYVREIVQNLELIKQGRLDKYEFGHDMTIYIYENNRSYLWCVDTGDEIDVDFNDVYSLMKDWRDYLDAWEKEIGKVKK